MLCLGGGANLLLGHPMHRRPLDPIVIRGRPVTKVNIVSFSISFGSPGHSGQWSLLVTVVSGSPDSDGKKHEHSHFRC